MQNADIEACERLYAQYFQTPLDRMLYMSWLKLNPRNRTPQQFESFLVNCPQYKAKLHKEYHALYAALVDTHYKEAYFHEFIQAANANCTGGLRPLTHDDMQSHIRQLPCFVDKYKQSICRLYELAMHQPITDAILATLMKLVQEKGYTLEQLNQENLATGSNIVQLIKDQWAATHQCEPTSLQLNDTLECIADTKKMIHFVVSHYNSYKNPAILEFTREFGKVFGRDIHTLEYLKWYPRWVAERQQEAAPSLNKWLTGLFESHNKHLQIVKNLWDKYTFVPLAETLFIERYIDTIDQEGYTNVVVEELVQHEAYSKEMRAYVRQIYKDMYGSDMTDDDEEHMFCVMQFEKLDLRNEQITELVIQLKEETDECMQNLAETFTSILQRAPDDLECVEYRRMYREDRDIPKSRSRIEDVLYDSLEYHEIVKNDIRQRFKKVHGKDPMPSQLYSILQKALQKKEVLRDLTGLDGLV